jgi:hypothetical protein
MTTGCLVGTFRLAPEDGARFIHGLQVAVDRLPDPVADLDQSEDEAVPACQPCREGGPDIAVGCPDLPTAGPESASAEALPSRRPTRSAGKSRADALVAIAQQAITAAEHLRAADADPAAGTDADGRGQPGGLPGLGADRFQLVIHATTDTLTRIGDGPRLHPATLRESRVGALSASRPRTATGTPCTWGARPAGSAVGSPAPSTTVTLVTARHPVAPTRRPRSTTAGTGPTAAGRARRT